MCAAVSVAESSGGLAPYNTHWNCWGLIGYAPQSYEEGIADFYQFLWDNDISKGYAGVDGHSTPFYCEPAEPWCTNVDQAVRDIRAVYVPPAHSME